MAKSSSPKASVRIVYGTEGYLVDCGIRDALAWTGREVRQLDAQSDCADLDVLDLLRTPNFEGLPVTVIVDNADQVKESKSKSLRAFYEDRSPTDMSVVLVAAVRENKLSDMWAVLGAKGETEHHPKLTSFGEDDRNQVLKHIRKSAVDYGFTFDGDADLTFLRATGGDLYVIHNEFRKLAALASVTKKWKLTQETLSKVVAPNMHADSWSVAEAAFAKDRKQAMRLLSYMYENEPESASVKICAALVKELQSTLVARSLLDGGMSPDDIALVLEMNSYRCKKFFLPRVRKHAMKTLITHMDRLRRLDSDVKSGARSKRTLVELAVLSIAAA